VRALTVEQRRLFERAASQYQSDLAVDTYAQEYLLSRGIGPSVAAGFRLGSVRNPVPGDERFAGRLAIPYLTRAGVVNFTFRCMARHDCKQQGEHHRKYLRPEGVDTNLFNVGALGADEDYLCIAEGEIDTITLTMAGLPAIGVPGVANWKDHFNRCLDDFSALYLFADGDDAGYKLGKFLIKEVRVVVIRMPDGQDVNSIYQGEGPDGIRKRLAAARG
jgi:DNA primase